MSFPHTILGFLSEESMTGYDLKKHIDSYTQFFWHAELSQIYPTLKQLEAKGLISSEAVPQKGKQDKKIYSITKAGKEALIVWLNEPLDETHPTKSPMLLKLFFLGILDKKDILSQISYQLEFQRTLLKSYQKESSKDIKKAAQKTSLAKQGVLLDLIRLYGELQTQTSIQWLVRALEVIEKKM